MMSVRWISVLPVLTIGTLALVTSASQMCAAKSSPTKDGEQTYMANCEACHMLGKNVIKPGKDIVVSKKTKTLEQFEKFLSEEHGVMPAFPKITKDKKVLRSLYKFVKTLKDQKWEYFPNDKDQKEPIREDETPKKDRERLQS